VFFLGDRSGVTGDADHVVAALEQLIGDVAAGITGDAENDDLRHASLPLLESPQQGDGQEGETMASNAAVS
jgi:hypothetical protein